MNKPDTLIFGNSGKCTDFKVKWCMGTCGRERDQSRFIAENAREVINLQAICLQSEGCFFAGSGVLSGLT